MESRYQRTVIQIESVMSSHMSSRLDIDETCFRKNTQRFREKNMWDLGMLPMYCEYSTKGVRWLSG